MITLVPSTVTEEVIKLAQLVYPEVTMSTRIIDIASPGVSITHDGETVTLIDHGFMRAGYSKRLDWLVIERALEDGLMAERQTRQS